MAFEQMKQMQAVVWSAGKFELMAKQIADIHEDLVNHLGVNPGEDWLDAATGTGAVATLAAQRGANVTGQDIAPGLIETAARLAAAQGLSIDFEVSDVEDLPYPDESFDVVSSGQGAIFGPDHAAVARELTRVCRSGGRIGLTAWRPGGEMEKSFEAMSRFAPPPPEGAGNSFDWGRRDHVSDLLGEAFELEFYDGDSPQRGESPEALWELFSTALGPIALLVQSGDEQTVRQVHDDFIELFSHYRQADGTICQPREYVVIIGHKR